MTRLGDLASVLDDLNNGAADDCGLSAGDAAAKANRVLLAVDVDAGTLLAARADGFDTVIAHHSIGWHYYTAHRRVAHRAERVARLGFCSESLGDVIVAEQEATRRAMANDNRLTVAAMAQRLGMGVISAHSVADALFEWRLDRLMDSGEFATLMAGLRNLAAAVPLFPADEAVAVVTTPRHGGFRRPYSDIASVAPPSAALLADLLGQGCDLVVSTGDTPEAAELCAQRGAGLVRINHIVFDAVGMYLLAGELHRHFPDLALVAAETGIWLPPTPTTPQARV